MGTLSATTVGRWSEFFCLYSAGPEPQGRRPPGMGRVAPEAMTIEPLDTVPQGLGRDTGEQPLADSEELRSLIALGRERGYLTFEQIGRASCRERVLPTV